MYFSILKKDLKRKRTMNVILLIFIILVSTFISSSVNNMLSISTALDSYFEKAQLKDYEIITMADNDNDNAIKAFLDKNSNVKSWSSDENLYFSDADIKLKDGSKISMSNTGVISSFNISQQKFFDSHDNEIKQIKDGEIYLPIMIMEDNKLQKGDVISITNGSVTKEFTIADNFKDAFRGSPMMGVHRFIINDSDYQKISTGGKLSKGYLYSISTSNLTALKHDFDQMGFNFINACDKDLIATTYIMDMIIAGMLLVVSICLILISLVILRFTIVFTLNEEFREIGIMKAIGMKARRIRGLYIIKYLAISVVGAAIGFILSIPFGNMFLKQVSKNIIISGKSTGFFINFLCSAFIVIIVVLFCYFCTRKVNKFSAIEAIRNGSNGERFKRKGILKLSKFQIPVIPFMALNDILSGLKKFMVLIITFTIGIILVIVPIDTINTLKSDKIVKMFAIVESNVYMVNEAQQAMFLKNDRNYLENYLNDMKNKLHDKGIDVTPYCEMVYKSKISFNDNNFSSPAVQGTGITADKYTYTDGQPPKYANEVALTKITADAVGAKIGDTVKIKAGKNEKEYVVTAMYQTMTNMGEGIRFSEKAELDNSYSFGTFAIQLRYNDNPTDNMVKSRFEDIKKLFPDYQVYTGGEYIGTMIGNIAGQLQGIKWLIVFVIIGINMLVAVLMVKTFITKEKGEIGMLKSIGFRNSSIVRWQALRIGIIMLISTVLGALLSSPIAQISSGQVFKAMGASSIEFVINPLEVYLIYPLIIFAATMTASFITALQIRKISAQETNNIE